MQQPAIPQPHITLDALTCSRFAQRPDLVIAYLALHASSTSAGAVDLGAATQAGAHSLGHQAWAKALTALTREGLLYVQGLEPRLAPLTSHNPFQSAWSAFTNMVPTLRGRTIAAYRAEVAKTLELTGFQVAVDERVPAGAKKTVPVHVLATVGTERVALVCCREKAVETYARKLQGADVDHAYLLVHPSNELVAANAVEVSEPDASFDPGAVDLPGNVPREAWLKWVDYRRETRRGLTRTTVKQQLKLLETAGPAATEMIMTSINSSWMGLFLPKRQTGVPAPRGTTPITAPRFQTGQLVTITAPDGQTQVVTAEVVSTHYVIDEHGNTHPIEQVTEHHPLRRAS